MQESAVFHQKIIPHGPQGPHGAAIKPHERIREIEGRSELRPVKGRFIKQPSRNSLDHDYYKKINRQKNTIEVNRKRKYENSDNFRKSEIKKKENKMDSPRTKDTAEVPIDQDVLAELGLVKTHEDQEV